jgi:radical SAM protein with 4Fe4S-binding SPASM domain
MMNSSKSQAETIRQNDKFSSLVSSIEKQLQTRSCLLDDTSQRLPYMPYFYDLDRWPGPPAHLNMAKQHAARMLGFPLKFNVEVTTQCVYKCEFCVLHSGSLASKRSKQFMKYKDFAALFSQIEPFVTHIEFTGGEPFLNKDLFRMIDLCNKSFVKTTLATNAKLLTEKNIAKLLDSPPSNLLIAYEAGEAEAYERHRVGGNLGQLESNIKSFMEARDARRQGYPRTQLQTVVSRETAPYMDVFWERARLLNVDEACSKPVFVWPDGDEDYWKLMKSKYLIPDHPLSYYESDGNGGIKETGVTSFCPNLQNVHIGSDGKVIHCWYNLLSSKPMGNVFEKHFVDIWFSGKSDELREAMKNHTAYEHECRFCIGIYKEELFKRKIYRQAETC